MSHSTMTLIGLNNFLQYQGTDLFGQFYLPDGIDSEIAIQNILLKADDKELLYPDANFMINAIGLWCKKWEFTFQKWIDVLSEEYDPLENYNRYENWSDSASTSESESNSVSASDSSTGSESMYDTVSAFNVSTYSPSSSNAENGINASQSTSVDIGKRDKLDYSEHGGRIHGNIGVTTSQQMLLSELELYENFNIYDRIAIIFLREFVLAL